MEVGEAAQPFNQQVGALLQGGIEYTRVYNEGKNTLAQVGVMGSGIHYDRHGLVPYNPFQLTYEYVVKNKSIDLNRLLVLYKTKLERNTNINPGALFDLGISPSPLTLFEYQGGPDSVGGIGATTIPRFIDTDFDYGNSNNTKVFAFNYNQLSDNLSQASKGQGGIKQDFRKRFLGNIASSDYLEDSLEKRYKIGNPGNNTLISRINYNDISNVGQDELNFKPAITTVGDPWKDDDQSTNDLIKFGFEAINYSDVSTSTFIQFRAYLDSFTDNHQANYNPIKYIGRGETFYAYDGFTRQISFGFLIAAQTRQELIPLYDKLNILASQIYPDYGENSFMRAPVVKMTIGDYMYRQPGFLNSINLSIDNNYPWEIQLDKNSKDKDVAQLPQVIKADCQFTPLHDFLPRKSQGITTDFITGLINSKRYNNTITEVVGPETPETVENNTNIPNAPTTLPRITDNRNVQTGITDTRNTQVGEFGTRLRIPRT
jgi:hypothetical protein